MKKIIIFAILLITIFSLPTQGNRVETTDYFHVTGSIIDTAASGVEVVPDSVFIATYKGSATPVFSGWFNTGDAQCAAAANNGIVFFDVYGDIDGAGGDGSYYTTAEFYDDDRGLYHISEHWWEIGILGVNTIQISNNATVPNNIELAYNGVAADSANPYFANIATFRSDGDSNQTNIPTITQLTDSTWLKALSSGAREVDTAAFLGLLAIYNGAIANNSFSGSKFAARAFSLPKFDIVTAAAFYGFAIWLDDTTSNTNSIVGVDGTPQNPVSTLAAARILADSMELNKYYLRYNSSFTLDAAYENWEFIGIGAQNEINFGDQDVDGSYFENLMLAGTQGGTNTILIHRCYMDAADSLECVATNSWFSDTISVRVADNIIFHQCYSAVPGNNTPGLDFNSADGIIGANVRDYSGGIALLNMTSNHTISYEADGQLVIDGSCTSANVTARGNMTITDNGTTTALTDDAVFNKPELVGIIWDTLLIGSTFNIPGSAGRRLRQLETGQVLLTGTINTANDSTATLDLGGAYDDGFFTHNWLVVTVGDDSVQIRQINSYTGATDSVDMAEGEAWVHVPSNGDEWQIVAATGSHVVDLHQPVLNQIAQNVRDSIFFQIVSVGNYATTSPDSFLGRFNLNWNNISGSGGVTVDNMENDVITDGAISESGAKFIGFFTWDVPFDTGFTAGSMGDSLSNASYVQGGAASLDSLIIRRWVWYADSATFADSAATMGLLLTHIRQSIGAGINTDASYDSSLIIYVNQLIAALDSTNASMGYDSPDLHTKIDNLSLSGGGTEPETLIVLSTGDSTQIQGARITLSTINQATVKVDGLTTDVNGKRILGLDADSFFVNITANNYTQISDTIVVAAGGQTDTLFMTLFDPGSPSNPDLCRLYGTLYDYDGSKLRNTTVRAQIPTKYWPVRWDAKYAFRAWGETETDTAGYFQIDLYPSVGILTGLGDSSSVWEIIASDVFHEFITLPDTSQLELTW